MSTRIPATWPGGKRVAIVVQIMAELWPDGVAPQYGPNTTTLKPGTIDHSRIAWARYGSNEGIWRLLRILDRHGVPGSFAPNARVLEMHPAAIKAIRDAGHTLIAHAYTQDEILSQMTPDAQREVVRRSVRIFEGTLGLRPEGWASPVVSVTPETATILAEEGFRWHVDLYDSDLPRKITTPKGVIVGIPSIDYSDNRVLRGNPLDLFDTYRTAFDYLYREEPGGMLVVGFHGHSGGRPIVAAMLDKLLGYFKQHPDVWFARHPELAQWAIDNDQTHASTYPLRFFGAPP